MAKNDNTREVTSASQPDEDSDFDQVESEAVGGQETPEVSEDVTEAIEAAVESGDLPGSVTDDAPEVGEAQVEHADKAYNLEEPGAGVVDATVEADLEARTALAADSHREVPNEELGSLAIDPDNLNTIRP